MTKIAEGQTVRCLHGSIDKNLGAGQTGRIEGFARFSQYHAREAFIVFDDMPNQNGWFWIADLEPSDA